MDNTTAKTYNDELTKESDRGGSSLDGGREGIR